MLKITKGLKKKKKGKKSKKNKEEELFKPEELEAYRREHQQQQAEASTAGETDEWKKFQVLTDGIDNVLRKTQGDLDRIKSTSFFQRVTKPSEKKKADLEAEQQEAEQDDREEKPEPVKDIGVVVVSESESEEEEEEDDIFDTSFVDAVESGEVKLAYIPESPTADEAEGDDPFDTSIAERAILGPAVNTRGRKLVPLGAAVEVLTGRVEQVTCATKRPSPRRNQRQQDLLLSNFETDTNGNTNDVVEVSSPQKSKSLLDDDSIPLEQAPIDLSGVSLHQICSQNTCIEEKEINTSLDTITQFDVISQVVENLALTEPDDEDDEFALLAAESLSKPVSAIALTITEPINVQDITSEFEVEFIVPSTTDLTTEIEVDVDPFDTAFAENILPGKAELKLIESEILNANITDTRGNITEKYSHIIQSKVSIQLTNPTGDRESISSLDRVDESSLNSLQTIHRDLLGGSNTDLSNIGDDPITPSQPTNDDSLTEYCDPFDTSTVDQANLPGQAELKFIEKEILGDVHVTRTLSDPDFNPRNENSDIKSVNRPDILEVNSVKSVAFVLPTPKLQSDLLEADEQDSVKHAKPLTPYYVRDNSISDDLHSVKKAGLDDPFDTSFVAPLAPGKIELKLIENEFVDELELKTDLSDDNFNPRATEHTSVKPVIPVKLDLPLQAVTKPDLFEVEGDLSAKVLTPAVESISNNQEILYSDPFDTSIASNILPGRIELKLLEHELINSVVPSQIKRVLTDPEFDPRNLIQDFPQKVEELFDNTEEQITVKPLTPVDYQVSFEKGEEQEIDPFDTSVADNLVLGRTELKILESELI